MEGSMEKTRRDFLCDMGRLACGAAAATSGLPGLAAGEAAPDVVVASGEDPKALVRKAVAELGGMKRFVSRGDVVVIKPNMAWVRRPETAANTNPDVIAALIEMAFEAGAKEIKVFDRTDRKPEDCHSTSGIADAARALGAKVFLQKELPTVNVPLKDAVNLKESLITKAALECDCFINVPVAKHHRTPILTLAMKNHLGVTDDDHQKTWHRDINQSIADFALHFKPKLTVIDAYRILLRNGPSGGNLQDVELVKKCIAGVNQASVDAVGSTLFPMYCKKPGDIPHIALAGKMGVGEIDLAKLRIREVKA
jgi:uncharacterized protein (DUF362 family)